MKAFHLILAANLSDQPGPPQKLKAISHKKLIKFIRKMETHLIAKPPQENEKKYLLFLTLSPKIKLNKK